MALSIAVASAAAQSPAPAGTCTSVGDPVALQVDGKTPIVAGRDGAVARFDPPHGSGPPPAPTLRCTTARGVVGLAIDAAGTIFLADASIVHVLARTDRAESRTFSPALAAGDSIVAIALTPAGEVELAIANDATRTRATRFAVFGPSSSGVAIAPARSYRYDAFLGPVSGITIDSFGFVYAVDDGGEILVFSPRAADVVSPVRRIYGPGTGLRPAVRGPVHGTRALALDGFGHLYAADDGAILVFRDDKTAADVFELARASHLGLLRGIATASPWGTCALSLDPSTRDTALECFDNYFKTLTSIPIP